MVLTRVSKLLSEGHICCCTGVRGPDFLRNVIVSGKVAFSQITFFVNIFFSSLTKWPRGPHLARGRSLKTPGFDD